MAATIFGVLMRIVGRCRAIWSKSTSAVGCSGNSAAEPPTESGKKRLEPVA